MGVDELLEEAEKLVNRCDPVTCSKCGSEVEFTEQYENDEGYSQTDTICKQCGFRERAFTGPKASKLREFGYDVPQKDF